jgi:hypothetical protein
MGIHAPAASVIFLPEFLRIPVRSVIFGLQVERRDQIWRICTGKGGSLAWRRRRELRRAPSQSQDTFYEIAALV